MLWVGKHWGTRVDCMSGRCPDCVAIVGPGLVKSYRCSGLHNIAVLRLAEKIGG